MRKAFDISCFCEENVKHVRKLGELLIRSENTKRTPFQPFDESAFHIRGQHCNLITIRYTKREIARGSVKSNWLNSWSDMARGAVFRE